MRVGISARTNVGATLEAKLRRLSFHPLHVHWSLQATSLKRGICFNLHLVVCNFIALQMGQAPFQSGAFAYVLVPTSAPVLWLGILLPARSIMVQVQHATSLICEWRVCACSFPRSTCRVQSMMTAGQTLEERLWNTLCLLRLFRKSWLNFLLWVVPHRVVREMRLLEVCAAKREMIRKRVRFSSKTFWACVRAKLKENEIFHAGFHLKAVVVSFSLLSGN